MTRGIYLPSYIAIERPVFTLSWGQGKIGPASVTWWPCPKVTEMGTKKFSHTQMFTMCGLKKLASGVLPESWKVLAAPQRRWRWQQRRRRQKWTKNNKSPGYPGSQEIRYQHIIRIHFYNFWIMRIKTICQMYGRLVQSIFHGVALNKAWQMRHEVAVINILNVLSGIIKWMHCRLSLAGRIHKMIPISCRQSLK